MLKKLTAVLVSILVAMTLGASAATAYAPAPGPKFNNPKGGTAAKYRLQLAVERAVRATPRGATILVTSFLMDRRESGAVLRAARHRGVHVQVVLDNDVRTAVSQRLKRVLNRDNGRQGLRWGPDQSYVVQCAGSCRSSGAKKNMHSKYYAFSRTGTSRNVVMVSSANLNRGSAALGWNDMFTMVRNPAMYRTFKNVHDEMARDRRDGNPYVVQRTGRFETQFFPKPRSTKASDPTFRALARVNCRGVAGGAGRKGRTAINVNMFRWSGERGKYLAQRLINLDRNGCNVSAIYGAPSKDVARMLRRNASRGGINLYDSRDDRNGDGTVDMRVHNKYMLVNGNFGGDRSSWQVFTGSQNWGKGSLTGGDEVTLQITARSTYSKYMKHWNGVRSHSRRKG